MAEEAKKPKEKKAATPTDDIPQAHSQRENKVSRWTLEACMKAAKRFDSVDAWKHGFPSSYKAAVARGFDKQCSAHMTGKAATKKTVAPIAKKPAKPAKPAKTSKLPKSA